MKKITNEQYQEWLQDTIQEDYSYSVDPGEAKVTEDLNNYFDVSYSWQEWNEYYENNLGYIRSLEENLI